MVSNDGNTQHVLTGLIRFVVGSVICLSIFNTKQFFIGHIVSTLRNTFLIKHIIYVFISDFHTHTHTHIYIYIYIYTHTHTRIVEW